MEEGGRIFFGGRIGGGQCWVKKKRRRSGLRDGVASELCQHMREGRFLKSGHGLGSDGPEPRRRRGGVRGPAQEHRLWVRVGE